MFKYLSFLMGIILLLSACEPDRTQFELDEDAIKAYIEENNLDATRHDSGLYYVIEQPGTGTIMPNLASQVTVRYRGYFLDGTTFDQTQGNDTATFPLNGVIQGWQIGIPLFKKGGEGILLIPSSLAYGRFGRGPVPPNTVLVFDIELVNF